jgi:hypothetical protein
VSDRERYAWTFIVILILLMTIGGLYFDNRLRDKAEQVTAYEATNDSLVSVIDRKGRETVSRKPIVMSDPKDFIKLDLSASPEWRELQSLVRQIRGKVQHAAIIKSRTELTSAAPTVRDTVQAEVYYKGAYKDEWVEWNGDAGPDSFLVHIVVDNEYQYTQVVENPIFKKPKVTAQVKNMNPYTRTKDLVSFDVDVPVDRFSLGPSMTYGIDPFTQRPHMVIGFGVQIKMIGIK